MQKLLKTLLILSLVFSISVNADQVTPIKKGEAAQYDGLLFDQEKANKIKNQLLDRDLFEEMNKSYQKSINLYQSTESIKDKQINVLLEQNDKLALQLKSAQGLNGWEKIGLFVLGVAATVGAGFAIRAATK